MDGDIMRVWQIVHELSEQIAQNQKLANSLVNHATVAKDESLHLKGTGVGLRRYNVDISKETFDSEIERANAQIIIENQSLVNENKQLSLLLKEYETTMETIMAKFRTHAVAAQRHETTLTQHYETLLQTRDTSPLSSDLASAPETRLALTRLTHHLRGLLKSMAGEEPEPVESLYAGTELDPDGTVVDPVEVQELHALLDRLDDALGGYEDLQVVEVKQEEKPEGENEDKKADESQGKKEDSEGESKKEVDASTVADEKTEPSSSPGPSTSSPAPKPLKRYDWAHERESEIKRLTSENEQLRKLLGIDEESLAEKGIVVDLEMMRMQTTAKNRVLPPGSGNGSRISMNGGPNSMGGGPGAFALHAAAGDAFGAQQRKSYWDPPDFSAAGSGAERGFKGPGIDYKGAYEAAIGLNRNPGNGNGGGVFHPGQRRQGIFGTGAGPGGPGAGRGGVPGVGGARGPGSANTLISANAGQSQALSNLVSQDLSSSSALSRLLSDPDSDAHLLPRTLEKLAPGSLNMERMLKMGPISLLTGDPEKDKAWRYFQPPGGFIQKALNLDSLEPPKDGKKDGKENSAAHNDKESKGSSPPTNANSQPANTASQDKASSSSTGNKDQDKPQLLTHSGQPRSPYINYDYFYKMFGGIEELQKPFQPRASPQSSPSTSSTSSPQAPSPPDSSGASDASDSSSTPSNLVPIDFIDNPRSPFHNATLDYANADEDGIPLSSLPPDAIDAIDWSDPSIMKLPDYSMFEGFAAEDWELAFKMAAEDDGYEDEDGEVLDWETVERAIDRGDWEAAGGPGGGKKKSKSRRKDKGTVKGKGKGKGKESSSATGESRGENGEAVAAEGKGKGKEVNN